MLYAFAGDESTMDNCQLFGGQACHANAVCVPHSNGYCCQCSPGTYGNGLLCLNVGMTLTFDLDMKDDPLN